MTTFINWCLILTSTAVAYWILTLIPFFQMDYHRRLAGWLRRQRQHWSGRPRLNQSPRRSANRPGRKRRYRQPTHDGLNVVTRFLHGFLYDSPYYPLGDGEVVHANVPSLWRAQEPKRLSEMDEHEGLAATYSHYVVWAAAAVLAIVDLLITGVIALTGFNIIAIFAWLVYQGAAAAALAAIYLHRLLSARIVFAHGFLCKTKPFKSSWTSFEDSSFGRTTGGPYGNVFWQRVFRRVPPWFWPGRIQMQAKESSGVLLSISPVHYPTQLRLLLDDVRVRFEASQGRIADQQERQTATLDDIRELLQRMADQYGF